MAVVLAKAISRFAAVALLVGLGGTVFGLGIAPLLAQLEENQTEITRLRELLERYQRVAIDTPDLRNQIGILTQRDKASGFYLHGSTDALVAAQLLDRLSQFVEGSGGKVTIVQNLPSEAADGLQKIAVRLQFSGSLETVRRVLYTIEAERPMLFIEGFEIRPVSRNQRASAQASEPDLSVRLDIAGYLRPET